MEPWIEIFRAGTWQDMNGKTGTFTEADLDAIVANYKPAELEAPLVLGHPKSNDPAYGWVAALKREGDKLLMQPKQVVAEFAQAVKDGRYKKRSIAVDPVSKKLLHVGFLGAMNPGVPGLADFAFTAPAAESVVFEFGLGSNYCWMAAARSLQGMRNFLVEKEGEETAAKFISQYDIDALKEMSAAPASDLAPYAAPPAEPIVPAPDPELERLRADNLRMSAELEKGQKDKRRGEILAFCDSLGTRILPAQRDQVIAFLEIADAAEPLKFGSGEATPALSLVQQFLKSLPEQLTLSEFAKDGRPEGPQDGVALGKAAEKHMEEEKKAGRTVTSAEAVKHVKSKGSY